MGGGRTWVGRQAGRSGAVEARWAPSKHAGPAGNRGSVPQGGMQGSQKPGWLTDTVRPRGQPLTAGDARHGSRLAGTPSGHSGRRTLARQRAAPRGSEALPLKQVPPQHLQYRLAAGPAAAAAAATTALLAPTAAARSTAATPAATAAAVTALQPALTPSACWRQLGKQPGQLHCHALQALAVRLHRKLRYRSGGAGMGSRQLPSHALQVLAVRLHRKLWYRECRGRGCQGRGRSNRGHGRKPGWAWACGLPARLGCCAPAGRGGRLPARRMHFRC